MLLEILGCGVERLPTPVGKVLSDDDDHCIIQKAVTEYLMYSCLENHKLKTKAVLECSVIYVMCNFFFFKGSQLLPPSLFCLSRSGLEETSIEPHVFKTAIQQCCSGEAHLQSNEN